MGVRSRRKPLKQRLELALRLGFVSRHELIGSAARCNIEIPLIGRKLGSKQWLAQARKPHRSEHLRIGLELPRHRRIHAQRVFEAPCLCKQLRLVKVQDLGIPGLIRGAHR